MQGGQVLALSGRGLSSHVADYDIVRKMRASILVLGPLLAREGHAVVSLPGGCAIGARPVDLHLKALEAMGAELELADGYVHAKAPGGLTGGHGRVPAGLRRGHGERADGGNPRAGTTVLRTPRASPRSLTSRGACAGWARRSRARAPPRSPSRASDRLGGATHPVVPDRIELGTYMLAPAICGGEVTCLGGRIELLGAFCEKLDAAGISWRRRRAG